MRIRRAVLAAGTACALLSASAVVPTATAQAATPGSSFASVASALSGTGINATTTWTGLLAPFKSLLSGVATPLFNTVTSLPSTLLTQVSNTLNTSIGLSATNVVSKVLSALPTTYPTCSGSGWTASNCFGANIPLIGLQPLLGLGVGLAQGYAATTTTGYASSSQITNPNLTVLGLDVGNLGVIGGSTVCGTSTGSCTAASTFTGASLFGGFIRLQLANNSNLLQVSIDNGPWTNVSDLSGSLQRINDTLGLDSSHNILSIAGTGNLLKIQGQIDLTALLNGIGLGGLLSGLSGLADANTVGRVTLMIGPGQLVTSTSAQSWGLEVGIDLSGDIGLSVLGGLAGFDLNLPSGITSTTNGNLLDLRLGYANASSGATATSGSTSTWVPPGLF